MSKKPYEGAARAAVWELTLKCTLRCSHCASSAGRARDEELTEEEAQRLCHDLKRVGTEAVCLFGGEFFLRRDWEAIAATLRSLGMDVSAATNGYAFDETLARKLLALEADGISVSLDAADPEIHDAIRGRRGAHARALHAITMIDAMGFVGKTVITSVTRRNLDELEPLAALILSRIERDDWMWMINMASCHDPERFGTEHLLRTEDFLRFADTIQRLRPAYRGRLDISGSHDLGYFSWKRPDIANFTWAGCRAGLDTIGIHSDGRVKGCLILPDAFVEGNIRETSLVDLWRDPDRFTLMRDFHAGLLEGACRGCAFGEVCKGGCKDIAYSTTGSPYHYPFCLHREEMKSDRDGDRN